MFESILHHCSCIIGGVPVFQLPVGGSTFDDGSKDQWIFDGFFNVSIVGSRIGKLNKSLDFSISYLFVNS